MAPALLIVDLAGRKGASMSTEELRVHGETDVERIGTRADADTERLAEEDWESAEERRRSAYRLT